MIYHYGLIAARYPWRDHPTENVGLPASFSGAILLGHYKCEVNILQGNESVMFGCTRHYSLCKIMSFAGGLGRSASKNWCHQYDLTKPMEESAVKGARLVRCHKRG